MTKSKTATKEKAMSFPEFLEYMDNGDAGAQHAIACMLHANEPTRMINALNKLDDLNIRGAEIWDLYAAANHDINKFFKKVEAL